MGGVVSPQGGPLQAGGSTPHIDWCVDAIPTQVQAEATVETERGGNGERMLNIGVALCTSACPE
jgi:hypothetical protein